MPPKSVAVLALRMDGEYLAHEVMRRALKDVVALQAGDPYCETMARAAASARTALAIAAELEGVLEA